MSSIQYFKQDYVDYIEGRKAPSCIALTWWERTDDGLSLGDTVT